MDFGKKVANLRKSQGMTQEELGKVLSVTYQAVSKWERGESLPDIETMSRIAKYFKVPIDYFVDDNENYQQPSCPHATPEPIGVCTSCGKMITEEEAYSVTPKIVCKSCAERIKQKILAQRQEEEEKARYEKQKEIAEQRGHGVDVTLIISILLSVACYIGLTLLCYNSKFTDDGGFYGALLFVVPLAVFGVVQAFIGFIKSIKNELSYRSDDSEAAYIRNLSLIIGGAFAIFNLSCFLVLYISAKESYYIFMLILSTVLSFTFVSQFMWGGIIQSIFTAGGFTFKLPGFIFSLTIESILFMIIAKLFLGIIAILLFIVTTVIMALIAILGSAFTFIPSIISKSYKDTKVEKD